MIEILRILFITLPGHLAETAINIAVQIDIVEVMVYIFSLIMIFVFINVLIGGFINVFKNKT